MKKNSSTPTPSAVTLTSLKETAKALAPVIIVNAVAIGALVYVNKKFNDK